MKRKENIRIYKYSDMLECIDINIRIFRYTIYKYIRILIYKYIYIQIFYYKKEINKVNIPKVRTSIKEKMFVKFAPKDNKGCTKCSQSSHQEILKSLKYRHLTHNIFITRFYLYNIIGYIIIISSE